MLFNSSLRFSGKEINDFGNSENDYATLVSQIYSFANQESGYEQLELTFGNVMRRVLEAFSTFTYKEGINAISSDADILNTISSKEKREYFANLMYRLQRQYF